MPAASASWHDLLLALAGAAAGLSGLLFVAVSLHPAEILRQAAFRIRAGSVLIGLLLVLVTAVLMLAPSPLGQASGAVIAGVVLIQTADEIRRQRSVAVAGRGQLHLLRALLVDASQLAMVVGGGLEVLWPGRTAPVATVVAGSLTRLTVAAWQAWALIVHAETQHAERARN